MPMETHFKRGQIRNLYADFIQSVCVRGFRGSQKPCTAAANRGISRKNLQGLPIREQTLHLSNTESTLLRVLNKLIYIHSIALS